MNENHVKILGALLAHGACTLGDLSELTDLPESTVRSALTRPTRNSVGRFVVRAGDRPGPHGRPAVIWEIRTDCYDEAYDQYEKATAGFAGVEAATLPYSEEGARKAFADEDVREVVLAHLSAATLSECADTRAEELEGARRWLGFELDRLADWVEAGYEVPSDVGAEMCRLRNWERSFDLGVPALSERMDLVGSVVKLADWLSAAIRHWFEAKSVEEAASMFAPLTLRPPPPEAPQDRTRTLLEQLTAVVDAAPCFPGITQPNVALALLMVLPQMIPTGRPEARGMICGLLDHMGTDRVGLHLLKRGPMDNAILLDPRSGLTERRFVIHALSALASHPRLLESQNVREWMTQLYQRKELWSDRYIHFYYRAFQHLNASEDLFVARHLDALEAQIGRIGDRDWLEETRGLGLDDAVVREDIARRVELARTVDMLGPQPPLDRLSTDDDALTGIVELSVIFAHRMAQKHRLAA